VKGEIDQAGRALLNLAVRCTAGGEAVSLPVWLDTAFTGELVIPRAVIARLGLEQSGAVAAGLADGTQIVLETYSCLVEWFGENRAVEVVGNDGRFALLGIGMLRGRRVELDYRQRYLSID
jgi:clan AA aspartic protease